jgi:hypothetical protein
VKAFSGHNVNTNATLSTTGPDPDFKKLGKVIVQAQNVAKNSERAKVLRALQDADIVHYAINPAGSSYQLNQMSVFGQRNMQVFSRETGGTAFLPKFKPIDTKDVYQNQMNMKRTTEVLGANFSPTRERTAGAVFDPVLFRCGLSPGQVRQGKCRAPDTNGS